jgi:HSP20 family molecular chaperone IbpA
MSEGMEWSSPFDDLRRGLDRMHESIDQMTRSMDRAFADLDADLHDAWGAGAGWSEEDDRFVMRIKLRGIGPDEVKVRVRKGTLVVSGKHKESKSRKWFDSSSTNHRSVSLMHITSLPCRVKKADVVTSFEDGVLVVSIPRRDK